MSLKGCCCLLHLVIFRCRSLQAPVPDRRRTAAADSSRVGPVVETRGRAPAEDRGRVRRQRRKVGRRQEVCRQRKGESECNLLPLSNCLLNIFVYELQARLQHNILNHRSSPRGERDTNQDSIFLLLCRQIGNEESKNYSFQALA